MAIIQPKARRRRQVERPQHFFSTQQPGQKYGRVCCWCGESIETSEPIARLNSWFQDHSDCLPRQKEVS